MVHYRQFTFVRIRALGRADDCPSDHTPVMEGDVLSFATKHPANCVHERVALFNRNANSFVYTDMVVHEVTFDKATRFGKSPKRQGLLSTLASSRIS